MTTISTEPSANPALPVAGTHNFRSTAGYPAAGGVIRDGALFRSDALHRLGQDGRESFAAHGIVRIIDLRDATELASSPSDVDGLGAEVIHHPVFTDAAVPGAGAPISLEAVYRIIVERHADRLAQALLLIADAPDGGVLVHCTAGKDRTGMVIAAALLTVGVPREQVLADYATSGPNLAGEWAETMLAAVERHYPGPLAPELRELILASPAGTLAATLDLVDREHGGITALLAAHGLDQAAVERLRTRLVTTV
ncbi:MULTISPECIES: tyrosine-protein phosphatase [Arthrobacter]|uniref:Tyrosine-protein phosphatase n=2 Tax=Arthrobacter TaxID=1663 RepID=A0ABU9KQ23_9MICC|nr:tyrosine-protein phosphatase [Arthrobacter sp. YJM1]MDP5227608.1 tyrosine-protein phosphatase [Arthrobacter sp. YJM1]